MSDKGKKPGGKFPIWFLALIILVVFVVLSPWIGLLIDFTIIFPPDMEVQGHPAPFLTILLPLFALILLGIFLFITALCKVLWLITYRGKRYEYLKIFLKNNGVQAPVVILHEIDPKAGRNSVRCILIYQNRYVECFQNHGFYTPIPSVNAMNGREPFKLNAFFMDRQEFDEIWSSRRYGGPLA